MSSEAIKEISRARKQAGKTFVFFRLLGIKRNIVVNSGDEVLILENLIKYLSNPKRNC